MRILLADDDPQDRALFRLAAESAQIEVEITRSRDELWLALESGETRGELPDVIVTDLHMSGMDLPTLLQRLAATAGFARIPLVVMSNSGALQITERQTVAAIGGFERKPVSFKGLEDLLVGFATRFGPTSPAPAE